MEKLNEVIQELNGDAVSTATITIYNLVGGAVADIFDDDEVTPLNNPFNLSDLNYNSDGTFWFKAANGDYNIRVVNGVSTKWKEVKLFDFEDATAPNDFDKTVDPTVNDDSGDGWEIGSRWLNKTTKEAFVALDVSVGAAVWDNTTLTIDELGTMALQDADSVNISGGTAALSGLSMTGDITTNGYIAGRIIQDDGTKLDGIEENADVTDSVNVEAAGAVMEADTSTASMQFVIDEDSFVSDSDTKVPTQQSVKAYVASSLVGAVTYQGGYDAATNTPNLDSSPSGIKKGYLYACTVAGTFFTIGLEVGDTIIAEKDDPTAEADWTIVNKDLNDASIKAAYENNADTNAFTDAEKTELGNVSSTYAPLASPALTGNPTAPTQTAGNDSTRLATTAFVAAAIVAAVGGAGFPAGTKMVFQQTSAPSGWTKDTTHNNKAFRVVSGTAGSGGSTAFTTAFNSSRSTSGGSVSNTSLSTAQLASHNHLHGMISSTLPPLAYGYVAASSAVGHQNLSNCTRRGYTSSSGSGSSHGHSFTNPSLNLNVQYVDLIIATKD